MLRFGIKRDPHWTYDNPERFAELLVILPKTWSWVFLDCAKRKSDAIFELHGKVCKDLLKVGQEAPWSMFGDGSGCNRPHVQRKIWLLMSAAAEVDELDHPWRKWKITRIMQIFLDTQSLSSGAPGHWQYNSWFVYQYVI